MYSDSHVTDTYDRPSLEIKIPIKVYYPTLELEASTTDRCRIVIDNMSSGIPERRTPRWITAIKGAIILKLNGAALDGENNFK